MVTQQALQKQHVIIFCFHINLKSVSLNLSKTLYLISITFFGQLLLTNHGDKYLHDDFAFINLICYIKYYIVSFLIHCGIHYEQSFLRLWVLIFVCDQVFIVKWIHVAGREFWSRINANVYAMSKKNLILQKRNGWQIKNFFLNWYL